jgi:hypothetical protein
MSLRGVRDDDVRVQERIARARGPVPERCGDEPPPRHTDRTARASPRHARFALEVRQRLDDCHLMCPDDLRDDAGLGDREQDADALGRAERQVEAGDGVG